MNKEIISGKAPSAIGPYSQAILASGNTVYVSGQLPINPSTSEFPSDEIRAQTRQSLENVKAVLEASDFGMNDVVKTTVLLADIDDFGAMNEVYSEYFTKPFPARAAFQVAKLPKGARVEIEAVASK